MNFITQNKEKESKKSPFNIIWNIFIYSSLTAKVILLIFIYLLSIFHANTTHIYKSIHGTITLSQVGIKIY